MPSSKDILEAQRFNRNRLITAFTSGTPDGREVDTPSPVRPPYFRASGRRYSQRGWNRHACFRAESPARGGTVPAG